MFFRNILQKKMSKYKIVMARHGESEWNKKNLFCGWVDVNLSEPGIEEAKEGAKALKVAGLKFDVAFTSLLKRAQQSLAIILKEIAQPELPVVKAWQLNERHYGALTGYDKVETAKKYGSEQVNIWRRSFDIRPPPMEKDHKYYKLIASNPAFAGTANLPVAESLKDTMLRVVPFWTRDIVPRIKAGDRVLVVAHGTSLRSLVKYLDHITDKDIMKVNLPNGIPFIYEFDENFKPVVPMKFLSDDETVRKAMEKVASIGPTAPSGSSK